MSCAWDLRNSLRDPRLRLEGESSDRVEVLVDLLNLTDELGESILHAVDFCEVLVDVGFDAFRHLLIRLDELSESSKPFSWKAGS